MDSFTPTNATIHTGDDILQNGTTIVQDGVVEYVGSCSVSPSVDLKGLTVTSELIDVQVNGGGDVLFNDAPIYRTGQEE
jgi:N-acetylglucosamine-6-phosphate deacetylase